MRWCRFSLIGFGAMLLAACGEPPTRPTRAVHTGVDVLVNDTLGRPLEGATVEVEDATQVRLANTTDSTGRSVLSGNWTSPLTVQVSREGFFPSKRTMHVKGGLVRVGQSLASTEPTLRLSSTDYVLTIEISPECTSIPEAVRTRRHDATVEAEVGAGGAILSYLVVGDSSSLVQPYGLYIRLLGRTLSLSNLGSLLYEHIPPLTYLDIEISGETTLDDLEPSTLVVPFTGIADYCVLNAPRSRSHNCQMAPAEQIVTREVCRSGGRLMLSPRRGF